jgi:phage terminase large subunit GpA-like protein
VSAVLADGFRDPIDLVGEAFTAAWDPPTSRLVSEWADEFRMLTTQASAEPGPWRTSRTEYLREPMNVLSPQSPVQRVILMFASQVGKTEAGNNWLGSVITDAPGPFLFVMPDLLALKKNTRQRIDPMIASTPVLRNLVAAPRSRDKANSMYMKEFDGGMLIFSTAGSASALANMPIRYGYGDEIDRWPEDVDEEGSPLKLLEQRLVSYQSRKKLLLTSTPTVKGSSAIEAEFERSDQRRFFVPCPHCNHYQVLMFRTAKKEPRLLWDKDSDGNAIPSSAKYLCESCSVLIEEKHKPKMIRAGRWQATAVGDGTVGFHLNALYSPFYTWREMVAEFVDANTPEKLKAFVNTKLAETFEQAGIRIESSELQARLEHAMQRGVPPDEAAVLIGTCDVQGNRLEAKVVAYGAHEESWLIDYEIFFGDPSTNPDVWMDLDAWRRRTFVTTSGRPMKIAIFGVDSGDQTDAVYDYVQPRQREAVFALRGRDYLSRPGNAQESLAKRSAIRLFLIATYACKDRILSRLQIEATGQGMAPGYMHLPGWAPVHYLEQLTSEKKIRRRNKKTGFTKTSYVQTQARNEALDLEVYALGMLFVLQTIMAPAIYRDLEALHARLVAGTPIMPKRKGRSVRSPGV